MNLENLAGHAIPAVLAIVAIVLILQSLFQRERKPESSDKGGKGGDDGEKAREPKSQANKELDDLYDFSADVEMGEVDDPYEITLMGMVPEELRDSLEGKLQNRSEGRIAEDVQELFLVTGVARSDRGKKRQVNEDAFLVVPEVPLFLVADGMGGYAGGDVAAQLAVDDIEQCFRKENFDGPVNPDWPPLGDELVRTIHHAHDAVKAKKEKEPKYMEMGTTIVAVRFSPDKQDAFIASVGDSRCYRLRDGQLKQLTTDHTLEALLGIGGKAGKKLTQAVGVPETVAVDLNIDNPLPEDMYLVCSDGLTKMVDDDAILKLTLETEGGLEEKARMLVEEANARGGKDNITVIVIRVEEHPENAA